MKYREIRELLDKYWQGESTLAEERLLKNFFRKQTAELPGDLEEVSHLFIFYEEVALQSAPDREAPWEAEVTRRKGNKNIIRYLKNYWEYAAIFLLMLGSVLLFHPFSDSGKQAIAIQDTYQNPQEAMLATQKALKILAGNLNKGKEEMAKLALFHEAQQKVRGQ